MRCCENCMYQKYQLVFDSVDEYYCSNEKSEYFDFQIDLHNCCDKHEKIHLYEVVNKKGFTIFSSPSYRDAFIFYKKHMYEVNRSKCAWAIINEEGEIVL